MKQNLRCQRIFILSLLFISVVAPIILVSRRLSRFTPSMVKDELVEELANIKYRADTLKLNAIKQETEEWFKEPELVLYKDRDLNSVVSDDSFNSVVKNDSETNQDVGEEIPKEKLQRKTILLPPSLKKDNREEKENFQRKNILSVLPPLVKKGQVNQTSVRERSGRPQSHASPDERVREIKDKVIRAKAYLTFAPPNSNSRLVKELKLRIKELERTVGEATKDTELQRNCLQKMRSMEASLQKAGRIYTDCSAMVGKLRAMTYNAEEQVRTQRNQASFLVQLASRTTTKGLHCLSMRLTADYFTRQPEERELSAQQELHEPDLYHYAIFSDNILACSVVVNSTISNSLQPDKVVIHVVTDALNLPAMKMWFLLNPPSQATIYIKSIEDFEWLSSKYDSLRVQNAQDTRYASALNHLRFYLPEMFPALDKIVLLDHDVVVQRDLKGLWSVNMKGKVNGAVETCQERDPSFRRMDMLINFSDPAVAKTFDVNACTWAFGMNVFDLREWRHLNLTTLYHKYLEWGKSQPLWKAGSLPLGLVTFYNQTVALDRRWHVLGLGYGSGVGQGEIERASVIHYDGTMKPWLDIGIGKYKNYWKRYVNYDHPYLLQCNIHE